MIVNRHSAPGSQSHKVVPSSNHHLIPTFASISMFQKYFEHHEPTYHVDNSVRQAALTGHEARQRRMEHVGDLRDRHA